MSKKITHKEFVDEVNQLYPKKYTILSDYCGRTKRILVQYNKCKHYNNPRALKLLEGKECPICCGGIKLTQEEFETKVAKINPHLRVIGKYENMNKPISIFCNVCNSETTTIASVVSNTEMCGCAVCCGKQIRVGYNDLWTTAPSVAELLNSSEDGYKVTKTSHQYMDFKCPICSKIIKRKVSTVYENGLCCDCHRKNVSFGERFLHSMLNQLGVDYDTEHIFEWSTNVVDKNKSLNGTKRYDVYVDDLDMVIEVHGIQHYEERSNNFNFRTLKEEQSNDRLKQYLALQNGIKKYIVLDCRKSDMDWIKKSILQSELFTLYDLSKVDWNKCLDYAKSERVQEISDLWNSKLSLGEICKTSHMSRTNVRKHLQNGKQLGLCDYSIEESRLRGIKLKKKRNEELATL